MKKAKTKRFMRFLVLALIVSLLAGTFSGCNKGGETGAGENNVDDVQVGGLMEAEGGYHVVELPRVHFSSMPLSVSSYEDFAYLIIDTGLYKLDCPAGVLLQIKSYAPQEGFSPIKVAANVAGIWVCERNGMELALRNFDTDGNLLSEKNYPGAVTTEENFFFPSFSVDANGTGYLLCGGQDMLVLGDTATALTTPTTVSSLAAAPDGQVYSFSYAKLGDMAGVIRSVTPDGLGAAIQLPMTGGFSLYNGGNAADFYLSDGMDFYSFDVESGISTKLFSWLTYGVDGDLYVVPQSDGAFCCLKSAEACRFEPGVLKEKKVLRLATMISNGTDLYRLVEKFNQESEDYVVEIENYGQFSDPQAGVNRLLTEMMAGDVPDLLDMGGISSYYDGLPITQLIRQGYLLDLYPLLDADPELSRDSLVPAYRSAMETDGKLYFLTRGFQIVAWCSSADLWEEGETWTDDTVLSKWENAPQGTWLMAVQHREKMIDTFFDYSACIDWENATCNFESEEFIRFLKAVAAQPTYDEMSRAYGGSVAYEDAREKLLSGEALFEAVWINEPAALQLCDTTLFSGEDYVFGGLPFSQNSTYPQIAFASSPFAITTACQEVDGAWEFLRYLITEEYQRGKMPINYMPTNQAAFDEFMKEQSTPNMVERSDGTVHEEPVDKIYQYYAINEEQLARFYELLDACANNQRWCPDQTVVNIITEECGPLFAGERTAEETAHLIQQRVSIYVAEQS